MVALTTSITAFGGYFRIVTGQAGAQVQLDLTHSQYFIITPTDLAALGGSDFLLGGQFEMKDGSTTTADLQINVYKLLTSGSPPTPNGPALATRTFSHTEFCAQVGSGNCQSFNTHTLDFLAPVSLDQTMTYYLELKSLPPPGPQNEAYFIKRQKDNFSFVDGPAPVPEPSSVILTALGLAGVARFLRRRSAANLTRGHPLAPKGPRGS